VGQGSAQVALAVGALLVAPALWRPAPRPWAVAFLATLTLCLLLPALPAAWPGERVLGTGWNWSGLVLTLLATLGMAALLVRRAGLCWREMGFTWTQRRGSLRPALGVSVVVLVMHIVWMSFSPVRLGGVTLETWLYQASMPGLVEELLRKNISVALDATNLEEHNREQLYHIADQSGARLVIVRMEAPPEVVRQRLEHRSRREDRSDHSDADWDVYSRMKPTVEKIGRNHFAVDSSKDTAPVIDKIARLVNR